MSDWLAQITLYGVDGDAEAPDGRDAHLALAAVRSRLPFIWCSVEAATADAIGSFRFNYGPVVSRPSNWLSTSRKINMQIDWKFGQKKWNKTLRHHKNQRKILKFEHEYRRSVNEPLWWMTRWALVASDGAHVHPMKYFLIGCLFSFFFVSTLPPFLWPAH